MMTNRSNRQNTLGNILKSAFLGTALLASTAADAAYNVYTNNGLSLDIAGNLTHELKKKSNKVKYEGSGTYAGTSSSYSWLSSETPTQQDEDRRERIGMNTGSSYLMFRGTQILTQDLSATATTGLAYGSSSVNLSYANIALSKNNWGSVSIGRQFLETVNQTSFYYPTEYFAGSSVRVDFTRIPRFKLSAYYAFPSSSDVRKDDDNNETQGAGLATSYRFDFQPDHSLLLGAAYSHTKRNVSDLNYWYGNTKKGLSLSAQYTYRDFRFSADYGKTKEDFNNQYFGKVKSTMWGVKGEYYVTPRLKVGATYASNHTKKNNPTNTSFYDAFATFSNGTPYFYSSYGLSESYTFPKIKENIVQLRADYEIHSNVDVYAYVRQTKTKNYSTPSELFTTRKDKRAVVGISFSF